MKMKRTYDLYETCKKGNLYVYQMERQPADNEIPKEKDQR